MTLLLKYCCLAFVPNKIKSMTCVGRGDSYRKIFSQLKGQFSFNFFILNIQNTHYSN